MNQNIFTIIIVVGALLIYTCIGFVARRLKARHIDGTAALDKVSTGLTYAQSIAAAITPFLPAVPAGVIVKALDAAQKAVTRAEATYKASISTDPSAADTRKTEAVNLVKAALALEGIADTSEIDKLIDVVIPLLVLALPKTHTAKVTAPATPAPDANGAA